MMFVLVTVPVLSRAATVVIIAIVDGVLVHCTRLHMQVASLQPGIQSVFEQVASPKHFS